MRKRMGTVFLAAAMITLLTGGCQNGGQAGSGSTKIFYTTIESGEYYEGWANQLKEQAAANGIELEAAYAENSVEAQVAQVKNALEEGSDALLCGLVSPDIAVEVKAEAGNVPIVFINNAPPDSQLEEGQYIYVASDEFMAGQYQAEYILEKFAAKDEINVVILKGPKDASGAIGRTDGLKQTLKASNKKINYVFEDNADWNEDKAKELISMFLKTGRQADCVAANNDDMAIGAAAAFEEAGADTSSVLFLGVDASANGCEAISSGRMDFTVYQPMSAQIEAAAKAAGNLAAGRGIGDIEGATEDGKYILLPFEKVDAGNVGNYK